MHAGEEPGPGAASQVRGAIEILGAERIGHGIADAGTGAALMPDGTQISRRRLAILQLVARVWVD